MKLKGITLEFMSIAVILGADLFFFHRAILFGEIFFERDTRVFYYPMMSAMSGDIRNWTLPLWSPNIFAGFPIFADGEAGLFYPPVMALFYFLPPQQAFIWTTVSHFFMAGFFTYTFLRSLAIGRFGSLVGGIAFMLAGFTVAQLHHVNISNSMVWLPLILYFVERSAQTVGARRHVNLLLAGGALGMQSLAVHINVVLMSLPVVAGYTAFRIILGPIAERSKGEVAEESPRLESVRWYDDLAAFGQRLLTAGKVVVGRLALLVWALAVVPSVGLAIGAVKLLPLYELGTFSPRAGGLSSAVSTSQAQTVYNLATLIFPYFFRDATNVSWGLWSSWETRVYVGIFLLLLSLTAVVLVRSRIVFFFSVTAVAAILVSLADSSPLDLHAIVSSLPGYNLIRAPGRYSYLWTFANAVLAAYGANWLTNQTMGRSHFSFLQKRWKPDSFLWRFPALVFFAILAAIAIELPFVVQRAGEYVVGHKPELLNLIQQYYLSLPRMRRLPEYALTPGRVYDALSYSLSFDNPSTRYGLIMVAVSVAMIIIGYGSRRAKWLWQIAVVTLVAGNLTIVGWQFHPTIQIDQLDSMPPVADFLKNQPGLYRVYSRLGTSTTPNVLLPTGIAEASGYSSIPYDRLTQFATAMEAADDQLMDILNVRYLISRSRYIPLPSYEWVPFHPDRPILASKTGNPDSRVSFSFPASRVDRIRVVSHLRFAVQVPQGTPVAEITLVDQGGNRSTSVLLAGVHTAEWAYDRPDIKPLMKHNRPAKVAFDWPDEGAPAHLYYAEIRLDKPITAQRVEIASTPSDANLRVYGLSALDSATGRAVFATRNNNERFKIVYRDADVIVRENTRYLPRAYLVPTVRVLDDPRRIIDEMEVQPFDARQTVIVEEKDAVVEEFLNRMREGGLPANIGTTAIQSYESQRVRISANAEADAFLVLSDSYYPGWRALVDGKETKIYRANYLFRAIKVPKGTHDIQFVFAPLSFQRGFLITLVATLVILAAWSGLHLARIIALAHRIWSGFCRLHEKWRPLISERVRALTAGLPR